MMRALILVLADPSGNPRPKRVFHLLEDMGFAVDIVSFPIIGDLVPRRHYEIPRVPSSSNLVRLFRKVVIGSGLVLSRFPLPAVYHEKLIDFWYGLGHLYEILQRVKYDLLVVEDIFLLPLAFKHKGRAKVLFDAREYYPLQREDNLVFRLVERTFRIHLCRNYLPLCDQVITVSSGLANEYYKEFKVHAGVLRSTSNRINCPVHPLRRKKLRMVHHGKANRNRKLENMLRVMELVDDRFSLDLFLTGSRNYIAELKDIARQSKHINIHDPVPFSAIVPKLNTFDIGFFFVEPTTFNLRHCLPNKLFEFIQARLMVAIGPSPDMAELVQRHDCGVVADSFDIHAMAGVLNRLDTDKVMRYKHNSDTAARELCWEKEGRKLHMFIEKMLNSS